MMNDWSPQHRGKKRSLVHYACNQGSLLTESPDVTLLKVLVKLPADKNMLNLSHKEHMTYMASFITTDEQLQ